MLAIQCSVLQTQTPEALQVLDDVVIVVDGDTIEACLLYTSDAADE